MRIAQIGLISSHTYKSVLKVPINLWLIGAFMILIFIALGSSYLSNLYHQHNVDHYGQEVRDRWENNPDKHPHRMAHYGYVAFRTKYPLSFFDNGIDSYLGNAVFLEAHRQNSVNFSQACLSSGLLKFGELSTGLLLQFLLPLLIFFWGYASISGEREKGVLKLFLTQGASWQEVILGKSLGISLVSLFILLPAFVITFILLICYPQTLSITLITISLLCLLGCYVAYIFILSFIAVWVSARSSSSKASLIKLIGFWLLFTLIIPKTSQVAGQIFYPTPSKIEFEKIVEDELIKQGDSHNPDDPHYNAMKDSLLLAHGVSSTKELPFNYSGYIMKEGEKLSTETYRKHKDDLMSLYQKQSQVVLYSAVLNPYIAIKHISMVLSGTDFESYQMFNEAAENYRYSLAQTMNDLQIEQISNTVKSSADKNAVISQQNWIDFPAFKHDFLSFKKMIKSTILSIGALAIWLIIVVLLTVYFSKNLKAI